MKNKIIRITTIPESMSKLLKGQLKFMSDYFEMIGVSSSGKGLLNEVGDREGIKVIPVEMTRQITPFKDLISTWQLYKLIKKEKPLIVHTHTPKAGTLGMLAAYMAGVPFRLHTVAGLPLMEAQGAKRWLLDTVEKITYVCATKIYPNSFGLKDIILENGYTSNNKLEVIGNGSSNGIDTNYFDPSLFNEAEKAELRIALGLEKSDFVFIFVGRLVRDKGINELIEAFRIIGKKYKNTRLLLVGPFEQHLDPLHPETEIFINNPDHVIALGLQSDVRPYFAISNCLVFPSYREGFPNVVLEAGAMGLPSIVTDINGSNEIIEHGKNGLIIPSKDEGALLQAMTTFVNDEILVRELAKNARPMIASRFERSFVWKAILKEYRHIETSK